VSSCSSSLVETLIIPLGMGALSVATSHRPAAEAAQGERPTACKHPSSLSFFALHRGSCELVSRTMKSTTLLSHSIPMRRSCSHPSHTIRAVSTLDSRRKFAHESRVGRFILHSFRRFSLGSIHFFALRDELVSYDSSPLAALTTV
jgi:hypothetical protein